MELIEFGSIFFASIFNGNRYIDSFLSLTQFILA